LTIGQREVVAALSEDIAQRIGEPRYRLWFAPHHTKFTWQEDQLVVGVPNHFFQEWLESKFAQEVSAAAAMVFDRPMQVRFVIDPELFQTVRQAQAAVGLPAEKRSLEPAAAPRTRKTDLCGLSAVPGERPATQPGRNSRRWHGLAEFVVGACNRVAHAAALAVIEAPEASANPLVIHGSVGTGKTHLLEGIHGALRKERPNWRICYTTSEEFTNRFVQAMRLGKLAGFRKHYREPDVLLIDDLHFLATKPATQEEFLHTVDALLANGRQLVASCDGHPRLTDEFTPELVDRLLGGAAWALQPPDFDTRLAILRAKAIRTQCSLPDDVVRYLADHLRGNVRELEGALHSVRHLSRVTERPIDLQLAREVLADVVRHAVRTVHLGDVDFAVRQVLGLEEGALQAKQRAWAVSHPRMLAIFLARKYTGAAYGEIGRYFGGRNHSTAVAAERKVRQWLREDGQLICGDRRLPVRDALDRAERELRR
jgi:chromosomal replication initiator protein